MDRIWLGSLRVNGVQGGTINVGSYLHIGASSSTKSNVGNGQINGDGSSIPTFWSAVDDSDLLDTLVWNCFGTTNTGPVQPPWV